MGQIKNHTNRITVTHFFLLAVILLFKMQSGHTAVLKGDAYENINNGIGNGLSVERMQ
jgi:hypothetical protein